MLRSPRIRRGSTDSTAAGGSGTLRDGTTANGGGTENNGNLTVGGGTENNGNLTVGGGIENNGNLTVGGGTKNNGNLTVSSGTENNGSPSNSTELSPIKAMLVALSGTLGVGNIAGVASAILIGGAGAVFWMWVSVVGAMFLKYAEITAAHFHRRKGTDGRLHGGAFWYMEDMARERQYGRRWWRYGAVIFAVLCVASSFTVGSSLQIGAIASSVRRLCGSDEPAIGGIVGIFVGIAVFTVISGGLVRIADWSVKLIPLMSGIYIVMSTAIIVANGRLIPEIFQDILSEALEPLAAGGGLVGILTSPALTVGVTRGIVSNEAGSGTAPIAHAGSTTENAAVQGVFGMLEVWIDTAVICSLTAFVVLIADKRGFVLPYDGMEAAAAAYTSFFPFADLILTAAVAVFAFGTVICWYYYGTESLYYLTRGEKHAVERYRWIFTVCCMVGALLPETFLWETADLTVSLMTVVNVTAILCLMPEIRRQTAVFDTSPNRTVRRKYKIGRKKKQ